MTLVSSLVAEWAMHVNLTASNRYRRCHRSAVNRKAYRQSSRTCAAYALESYHIVINVVQHIRNPVRQGLTRFFEMPKPRVVMAGVPSRKPLVTNGERGSFGTVVLVDRDVCAAQSAASASLPVISLLNQTNEHQVIVRVPPEIRSENRARTIVAAIDVGHCPATLLLIVVETPRLIASFNATALAAMTCMSGPP